MKEDSQSKCFLGGTCNDSTWRETLIPLLTIDYFNPVVEDWTEDDAKEEIRQREEVCDKICYVITPLMTGVYSIAEVVEDSIKRPEKTFFCVLETDGENSFSEAQLKSLTKVKEMVARNGATVSSSLEELASALNSTQESNNA